MKFFAVILFALVSYAHAQPTTKSYYLSKEDQKYYKNDSMAGNNQFERIDSLVKEVNKMYGEMANMKAEIQTLRKEVDELRTKVK